MKKSISLTFSGLLLLSGLSAFSQQVLPTVTITAGNYKYLSAASGADDAAPVQRLQRTAAAYDVKSSDYYEEDYENYFISFYLPAGRVLACYDNAGKMLYTVERYENVVLPAAVTKAVAERYPNWGVTKDVYLVNYQEGSGQVGKKYKLVLQNGDKRIRIATNEQGEIL